MGRRGTPPRVRARSSAFPRTARRLDLGRPLGAAGDDLRASDQRLLSVDVAPVFMRSPSGSIDWTRTRQARRGGPPLRTGSRMTPARRPERCRRRFGWRSTSSRSIRMTLSRSLTPVWTLPLRPCKRRIGKRCSSDECRWDEARRADMKALAEQHGARLKRSGRNWIGPCPAGYECRWDEARRADMKALGEQHGARLKRSGRNWIVPCPAGCASASYAGFWVTAWIKRRTFLGSRLQFRRGILHRGRSSATDFVLAGAASFSPPP